MFFWPLILSTLYVNVILHAFVCRNDVCRNDIARDQPIAFVFVRKIRVQQACGQRRAPRHRLHAPDLLLPFLQSQCAVNKRVRPSLSRATAGHYRYRHVQPLQNSWGQTGVAIAARRRARPVARTSPVCLPVCLCVCQPASLRPFDHPTRLCQVSDDYLCVRTHADRNARLRRC